MVTAVVTTVARLYGAHVGFGCIGSNVRHLLNTCWLLHIVSHYYCVALHPKWSVSVKPTLFPARNLRKSDLLPNAEMQANTFFA